MTTQPATPTAPRVSGGRDAAARAAGGPAGPGRGGQPSLPELLAALGRPTAPIRLPLLYRPAQLLVAVFMVALPLVYVGLIACLVAGVAAHGVNNRWMLEPGAVGVGSGKAYLLTVVLGYVGPLVVGSLAALFMVKPFFAPRPPIEVPLTLGEREQEALHRFVGSLCDALEAPRPVEIDVDTRVNAGARLRPGWRGMVRGEVSLTIGLPLAADLPLRHFAGVLAHEFGHFAQGGGMRLTLVIRSVNHWFARVVYERDGWDARIEALAHSESHWVINLVAHLTRLMIWLNRRVLWVLMVVGHVVSCVLLRQMEHDADRFSSRIAGSVAFVETEQRLALLGFSEQVAMRAAGGRLEQKRELPDDLPALIRAVRKRLPEPLRAAVLGGLREGKTSVFDTHPCSRRRCESVEREGDPGVLPFDLPARALFRDFEKLCRLATAAHYQRALGDGYAAVRLVPAEGVVPSFQVAGGASA